MAGEGRRRSEWNTLLLRDVIGPIYASLVLKARDVMRSRAQHRSLLPAAEISKPWETLVSAAYENLKVLPVLYSDSGFEGRGRWIPPEQAVVVEGNEGIVSKDGGRDAGPRGRQAGGSAASEEGREYADRLIEVRMVAVCLCFGGRARHGRYRWKWEFRPRGIRRRWCTRGASRPAADLGGHATGSS